MPAASPSASAMPPSSARYGDTVEISYVAREPGQIVIDFSRK